MFTIIITWITLFLLSTDNEQLSAYTGTFVDQTYQTTIKIKPVGDSLHGVMMENTIVLPFHAQVEKDWLEGKIYGSSQTLHFTAKATTTGLLVELQGTQIPFYKISNTHDLDSYDLSKFFGSQAEEPPSESVVKPNTSNRANQESGLHQLIAGGQLVYYTRASIMSGSNASSMTYLNFCKDGTFYYNYEGSYSVEGNYGGNAHGASSADEWGYWEVTTHQGFPAVKMSYANGEIGYQSIDEERLRNGRWRQGNTQYAFQRNKAACR